MNRRLSIIAIPALMVSFTLGAETWEFQKLLIDMQLPQSNAWGFHGVAVAPDGNIWLALHGNLAQDTLFTAEGDTINVRPIYVLDPDGNHVSFSPIRILEFPDGSKDTLHADSPHNGSGKGISVDKDGNILYTSWSTVYRINYQTGKAMNSFTPTDMSSMTEAVQDANGLIYVGYVLSAERPVYILDNDFNLIGNAIDTLGHINRTLAVTADGKDLYAGSTWNGFGIEHWHSDIPGVVPFTVVDTLGNWTNVPVDTDGDGVTDTVYAEVKLWSSSLDWGPDSLLWAGNLRPDWSGPKGAMYYAFDVSTGKIVDSVGIAMGDSSAGGIYSPRGAAWTADGQTMYLADYDYNVVSVWKKVEVSVDEDVSRVPTAFSLYQNYPNPFNPRTTIAFDLAESGHATLTVYDMLGREVAVLVDERKSAGRHTVLFDATGMASGMYLYKLEFDGRVVSKRMMYLK